MKDVYHGFTGAFLIPYLLFMVLLAVPLQYMEFAMAQFSNLGPTKIWNCCPLFKGTAI